MTPESPSCRNTTGYSLPGLLHLSRSPVPLDTCSPSAIIKVAHRGYLEIPSEGGLVTTKALQSVQYEVDSVADAIEFYYEKGWTDGLPVVPPTEEKVRAFLAAAGLEPDSVVGTYETRKRVVTAEKVAINSVMAGCPPCVLPGGASHYGTDTGSAIQSPRPEFHHRRSGSWIHREWPDSGQVGYELPRQRLGTRKSGQLHHRSGRKTLSDQHPWFFGGRRNRGPSRTSGIRQGDYRTTWQVCRLSHCRKRRRFPIIAPGTR